MGDLLSRARTMLKEFVDFGCFDLAENNWGGCKFCAAKDCRRGHDEDCFWNKARLLIEEIDRAGGAREGER